jgi:hypothetical protein
MAYAGDLKSPGLIPMPVRVRPSAVSLKDENVLYRMMTVSAFIIIPPRAG